MIIFFFLLISLGLFIVFLSYYYSGYLKSRLLFLYSIFLTCLTLDIFIEFTIRYWFIKVFSPDYFLAFYIILIFLTGILFYLIPEFYSEINGKRLFKPFRYFFIFAGIISLLFPIIIYWQGFSFEQEMYLIILGMRTSIISISIAYSLLLLFSIVGVIRIKSHSFQSFFVILSILIIFFAPLIILDIMDRNENFLARAIKGPEGINSIIIFFSSLCILNLVYGILFFIRKPEPAVLPIRLSKREKEIASMLVAGNSYKEISSKLFISKKTVKSHAYKIYHKTSIHNRVELRQKLLFR